MLPLARPTGVDQRTAIAGQSRLPGGSKGHAPIYPVGQRGCQRTKLQGNMGRTEKSVMSQGAFRAVINLPEGVTR